MDEVGKVKSVDGVTARVVIQKTGACDHCVKGDCEVKGRGFETEAINAAHATVGQTVKVVMKTQTYIKGALILYIVPVFALIAGAMIGQVVLPRYFSTTEPQTLAVMGGFISFILSLAFVKVLSSRMEKSTECRSVIEKVLENENENEKTVPSS
jgi:sigma-E factor negative regulatory protein RseC